jgi:RNA polymerase sigma factor (sigma-70 family)
VSEASALLDGALVRARGGDSRGFEALFRATGKAVVGYLRAHGVEDPDGVANEVFLKAFRTLDSFDGDSEKFRSWLFTITHNAAIDDARRRARRPVGAPLDVAPEPAAGDVEDDVMTRLADERVRQLLAHLSEDQREVLMLRIVADLSVEDTAAIVEKSYEAVKALQRRGLASLRRKMRSTEAVPR